MFTGNITYTEDDVAVRTLYVAGSKSQRLTKEEVEAYFTKNFGAVENTRIYDKKEHSYMFVTLANYEDAHRALGKKYHSLPTRRRLIVRAADSWHQPKNDIAQNTENSNDAGGYVYDPNIPSLDVLNDDCLLHLFDFLNIIDLLKIHKLSNRYNAVVDTYSKKFTTFDFDRIPGAPELTLMIARDILIFLGPIVKNLCINGDEFKQGQNRLLDIAARKCQVLESLEIDGFQLRKENLRKIAPLFKNLQTFITGSDTRFSEDISVCFEQANNLKHVEIFGNYDITGRCLTKLRNLETLSLNNCGNIQPKFFVQALELNRTLKKLQVQRCDKLNNIVVQTIVRDLKELQDLSISNSYNDMTNFAELGNCTKLTHLSVEFHSFATIDPFLQNLVNKNQLEHLAYMGSASVRAQTVQLISQLTNLKHLEMSYNTIVTDEDILTLRSLTKLEHFAIPGAAMVSPESILSVLNACPNLKFLDVTQTLVDEVFVHKILEILKEEDSQRPKLKLVLYNTKVAESMLENELVKELKDKIEISFLPHSMEPSQFFLGEDDDYMNDDFSDEDGDLDFDDCK